MLAVCLEVTISAQVSYLSESRSEISAFFGKPFKSVLNL